MNLTKFGKRFNMAHYALVENNIVVKVIVAEQNVIETLPGKWIKTSYNTRDGVHYDENGDPSGKPALRWNYASIGYEYNQQHDVFIAPKLFDSWILDVNTMTYVAPLPHPSDGKSYKWNEESRNWIVIE